jgi:hypothetical protein
MHEWALTVEEPCKVHQGVVCCHVPEILQHQSYVLINADRWNMMHT